MFVQNHRGIYKSMDHQIPSFTDHDLLFTFSAGAFHLTHLQGSKMQTSVAGRTPAMQRQKKGLESAPWETPQYHQNARLRIYPPQNRFHKIIQQPPPSPFSNVNRAALVAASKTSSTPSPVRDEHSKYLRAPISRAALLPSLSVVKWSDFFLISSWASGSSRRSFLSPTRMMGTPGQRSLASSTHLDGVSIR